MRKWLIIIFGWMSSSPIKAAIGIFLFVVLGYILSQLILDGRDFIKDPWIRGGLNRLLVLAAFNSLICALIVKYRTPD